MVMSKYDTTKFDCLAHNNATTIKSNISMRIQLECLHISPKIIQQMIFVHVALVGWSSASIIAFEKARENYKHHRIRDRNQWFMR